MSEIDLIEVPRVACFQAKVILERLKSLGCLGFYEKHKFASMQKGTSEAVCMIMGRGALIIIVYSNHHPGMFAVYFEDPRFGELAKRRDIEVLRTITMRFLRQIGLRVRDERRIHENEARDQAHRNRMSLYFGDN